MGGTNWDLSRACPARPVYGPFARFDVFWYLVGLASGCSLFFDHTGNPRGQALIPVPEAHLHWYRD